ncbi:tripartite ATP-independent transporter DctM subunit [Roseinatronobacter thiooxidans]|uniref:Tripartite ATP-independent transporter DctM subunit n=1 Tax=Roseinatronobacter thiooxidans TaxID=121821 RepID=A0A2W7QC84_9RHOB|nr:TRAP transporter large permease [Roseinatronobacter thiooxidans]PZX45811.1 tripartite ATP-independent transporter DctM subunit [Roseinatronobacter thiooxidans]
MSAMTIGLLSFPALLTLIFLRVPIGLAMFLTGLVGLVMVTGSTNMPFSRLQTETFTTFASYSLSIIPMFLLMGHFATLGGMSQALFKAAEGWLGHRKGGVAMAAIGSSAGFGAICGSSLATAATMSRVALPELKRYGYAGGFSTATLAAGGTLGILIPPSVVLVIYAILTEQNIAKLFLAAFIPGIMAALGYLVVISIYVRVYPDSAGTRPRVAYGERFRALLKVWPVMVVFGLVVGGIYAGWFTPTEGAAVGAFGTGLIAWANGGLTRKTLAESFYVTARSSAMIFFIIFGAAFYNGFLALTQVPQSIAAWVGGSGFSPLMVLILILCFYLVLGCVMDSLSMILLTIPIFWPIMMELDFNFVTMADLHAARAREAIRAGVEVAPEMLRSVEAALAAGAELTREQIQALGLRRVNALALERANIEMTAIWFGILVLIVVEVGLITPPVGMNLFVINAMDPKTKITDTYRAVMPFVASDLIRVVVLVAFPAITLFLVAL